MSNVKLNQSIRGDLEGQVSMLSEDDILKLEKGTHRITINLVKNRVDRKVYSNLSESLMSDLLAKLKKCRTREQGISLISQELTYKKDIEQFANYLDVYVSKQHKVEKIKKNIVEATVGAILRSNAIRGTNKIRQ